MDDPNVITNFGAGPIAPTGPKTVRRKHLPFSALSRDEVFLVGERIWHKRGFCWAFSNGERGWWLPWTLVRTLRTVKKIKEVTK